MSDEVYIVDGVNLSVFNLDGLFGLGLLIRPFEVMVIIKQLYRIDLSTKLSYYKISYYVYNNYLNKHHSHCGLHRKYKINKRLSQISSKRDMLFFTFKTCQSACTIGKRRTSAVHREISNSLVIVIRR